MVINLIQIHDTNHDTKYHTNEFGNNVLYLGEWDDEYGERKQFLKKGNVGDQLVYSANNQMGNYTLEIRFR